MVVQIAAACAPDPSVQQQRTSAPVALPGSPPPGTEQDIAGLSAAIFALGPNVDPEEAARAARIAYEYTYQLALQYQITDPALIHNIKVNSGRKPRGLCRHWAEDMEDRLQAENFETLTIHRAIGALVGVDHSTAIISAQGDDMYDGIVIDPWRNGGRLTWIETDVDTSWGWEPQFSELDRQAYDLAVETGVPTITYRIEDKPARCLVVADGRAPSREVYSSLDMTRCLAAQDSAQTVGFSDLAAIGGGAIY